MSVVDKIKNLIDEIESDKSVLRYSYNTSDIVPGETPIYYSGPYWDSDELKAGVVSFLTGKWLSSGEKDSSVETQLWSIVVVLQILL